MVQLQHARVNDNNDDEYDNNTDNASHKLKKLPSLLKRVG